MCASLNNRKKMKAEPIWLIPQKLAANLKLLIPLVWREFRAIGQFMQDGFWVAFTKQLDSKLNNSKSTCLINVKFSGKLHFHKKNIRPKSGCKRPSMRKVIVFCS